MISFLLTMHLLLGTTYHFWLGWFQQLLRIKPLQRDSFRSVGESAVPLGQQSRVINRVELFNSYFNLLWSIFLWNKNLITRITRIFKIWRLFICLMKAKNLAYLLLEWAYFFSTFRNGNAKNFFIIHMAKFMHFKYFQPWRGDIWLHGTWQKSQSSQTSRI